MLKQTALIVLLIFLSPLSAEAITDWTDSANGCVFAFLLDESSGDAVDSCDGTYTTTPGVNVTQGYSTGVAFGTAYDFDGVDSNDSVINTSYTPNSTSSAMVVWYNTGDDADLASNGTHDGNNRRFYLGVDEANEYYTGFGTKFDVDNPGNVSLGVWQHLAMVRSTTDSTFNYTVYTDGVSELTVTTVTFSGDSANDFRIGGRSGLGEQFGEMRVDELAAFESTILDSTDVNDIMDNGLLQSSANTTTTLFGNSTLFGNVTITSGT